MYVSNTENLELVKHGVGVCVCVFSHSLVSLSLCPHGLQPARPLSMEFSR